MTTKNFNVKNGLTTGNIVLDAATGNISATNANLGNLVTANYFSGDGSLLGNLNVASIGTVANANYAAYAGNILTAAQPNITSLGNLSVANVTGNLIAGNILTGGTANVSVLTVASTVSSNLIPTTTATYTLGSPTNKWKEVYVSGNVYFGSATLTDVSGTFTTANANIVDNLIAGNVYANAGVIQGNLLTGTLTTATQPNITSVGTLTSLGVTGNVSVGGLLTNNYYYANGAPVDFQQAAGSNGQIQINNNGDFGASSALTFDGTTSTLNVGNISTTSVVATTLGGNLTTAAQPNVTSVGTLTSLDVSGNTHITANTVSSSTSTGALVVDGGVGIGGNLSVNGKAVLGDDVTVGGNLTVNGTLTTVNSTTVTIVDPIFSMHTGANNAALTTDDGKDVGLLMNYYKDSAKAAFVGWTNDSGFLEFYANATETSGVITGDYGVLKGLRYVSTATTGTAPLTVASTTQVTNLNAEFSGTVTTNAQPNITSVGTLTSLSVSGTISGTLTGDGSGISNITGANVTGTVPNANMSAYAGNITLAAQPNITSVGTLTSLSVTGNITAGNVSGGNLVSATYLQGTLTTNAQPNITSVGTLANLTVADTLTAGNIKVGSSITIGTDGTITANSFSGNITGNISGNFTVSGMNTQVLFNDSGTANASSGMTFDKTSNLLTIGGNLVAANVSGGNLVAANYISGNGSLLTAITGANVTGFVPNATFATSATTANVAGTVTTNAQPNITSVGTLSSLSVVGNISSGNVSGTLLTGTLTTAAQPNVTSVGTLSSLTVSGVTTASEVKLDVGLSSNRPSITLGAATIIDEFPTTSYRGAKYVISGKSDNGFQSTEVLLVHSGTQAYITIYGYLTSGTSDVFDVTSNVDVISGNVRVYASNIAPNTTVNLVSTYVQD